MSTRLVLDGSEDDERAGEESILNRVFDGTFPELKWKQESGRTGHWLQAYLVSLLLRVLRDAEVHLTVCCGTLLLTQGEPHPSLFQSSRRGQLKPEHVLIKSPAGNPADRQGQEPLARSLDFITLEKLQGHGKN